jgi:uncharacterized protein YceK
MNSIKMNVLILFAACLVLLTSGCTIMVSNQNTGNSSQVNVLTNQTLANGTTTLTNLSSIDISDFNVIDDSVPNLITDQQPTETPAAS